MSSKYKYLTWAVVVLLVLTFFENITRNIECHRSF